MKKSLMQKMNWIMVISGVLVTYFGFFLMSFITTNYDGVFAFITVLITVAGLVTVALGLAISFKSQSEPK